MLVICGGFLLLGVFIPAGNDVMAKYVIMTIAGLGAIAISWWSKREFEKYDIDDCRLIGVLETNNKNNYIVWIYPQKTETKKYGATIATNYSLIFKTIDKAEYIVQIPSEQHYTYITMLRMVISNITYGFSEDRKKLYKESPTKMIVN
ncbi:MAG: DUF6709 family protein [Chitinophagales bacterium]